MDITESINEVMVLMRLDVHKYLCLHILCLLEDIFSLHSDHTNKIAVQTV